MNNVGKISIDNCKSRVIQLDDFYIANGEENNAFVHLDVRFMEGRSDEIKTEIGKQILAALTNYFDNNSEKFQLQISIEIVEIMRSNYFKYPSGTL